MARPKNPNKLVRMSLAIEPHLRAGLLQLTAATRVPINSYVREAVADVLQKHAHELKPQSKRRSKS